MKLKVVQFNRKRLCPEGKLATEAGNFLYRVRGNNMFGNESEDASANNGNPSEKDQFHRINKFAIRDLRKDDIPQSLPWRRMN